MPIRFTCPHCESQTLVDDCYAGQSGPCATCGKPITIPHSGTATPTAGTEIAPAISTYNKKTSVTTMIALVAAALVSAALVIGVLVAMVLPALSAAGESARRLQCEYNLQTIVAGLRAYHEVHQCFPPAYVADELGRPKHSWRVLILPYLNEQTLYDQYDLRYAWDSQQNLGLMSLMPSVYGCPSDPNPGTLFETSYMLITGPGTAFNGANTSSYDQITDDLGQTVLLVECHTSNAAWMEPKDLDILKMQFQVNGGTTEINSLHTGGAYVVTADGTCRFLPNDLAARYVQAMLTIRGGESLPADVFDDVVR